ncbi:MAG: tetratricopeptide repeat protein, partial [Elusimicrobiota bacterium]
IAAGRYRKARLELQALLDQDPGDPQLESLQARLDSVIRLAPQITPDDKAARAAIRGLKGYLGLPLDHTLAHNALRYACELSANKRRYDQFLALLLAEVPALANEDAVTPGMKLLEYKHFVALHQIYDAKYHLAVATLGEILALEPNDLLAHKRLGSAYYSLGRMTEARRAWSTALALAPQDKTLRQFLEKTRR